MMRTADEFKQAAIKRGIRAVDSHDCSICGYMVGYKISDDYDAVWFDHGCDCTGIYATSRRDWQDIANSYNMQSHELVISRMNEFWGFDNNNNEVKDGI